MAEYATKGQGTAGVTLGTIGTVLGGLATLGGANGGGLLGGILGNNTGASMGISSALAEKDAKIAELTAQKYSDTQDAILYKATVDDDTVRELEKIYKCLLHIKCLKDNKQ